MLRSGNPTRPMAGPYPTVSVIIPDLYEGSLGLAARLRGFRERAQNRAGPWRSSSSLITTPSCSRRLPASSLTFIAVPKHRRSRRLRARGTAASRPSRGRGGPHSSTMMRSRAQDWLEDPAQAHRKAGLSSVSAATATGLWEDPCPSWFPGEFSWDHWRFPTSGCPRRRPRCATCGPCAMLVKRERVRGRRRPFREDFGKIRQTGSLPEDTDLCLRIAAGPGETPSGCGIPRR